MRVVIIGAGGHGQVVADILFAMNAVGGDVEPVGYLDGNADLVGSRLLGLPVLGPDSALPEIEHDAVIVAIGDNGVRRVVYSELKAAGERIATAVHPQAVLGREVSVGEGAMVCAGAVINSGTSIGPNTIVNTRCSVDHHNDVAAHVHLAPGATLGGEVSVGEGAFVGIGATVMPRASVGQWATVGAGALVTKQVDPGAVVVGVPSRRVEGR